MSNPSDTDTPDLSSFSMPAPLPESDVMTPPAEFAPVTTAAAPTTTPGTPATTPERRPRSWGNAYTWMLILSLIFLMIGCLFLLRELSAYNFQVKPT
jgi:hypothetical protein